MDATSEQITLEVPNYFVQEYLITNYKEDLRAFLPVNNIGEPAIQFVLAPPPPKKAPTPPTP